MILPQKILVKWHASNKNHYVEKNYPFTKMGNFFYADVFDLLPTSKVKVNVQCDYCGETHVKNFNNYTAEHKKNSINKDACKKCINIKREESVFEKHSVKNVFMLDEVKEKTKNSHLKNYGVDHYSKTNEYKLKFLNTSMERYGVTHPWMSSTIRKKSINTLQKNYQVDNPLQNTEILNKVQQTNLERYGVKSPLEIAEIQRMGIEKLRLLKKDMTSRQQRYIGSILPENQINFPFNRYLLDIAFPNEKIFIEYDGSGHNLSVQLGKITQEEFDKKEKVRFNVLYSNGWREIRLVSTNDMLPDEDYLKSRIISEIDRLKENKYLKRMTIYLNKIENVNFHRIKGEI